MDVLLSSRALREHFERRDQIDRRRVPTKQWRESEREHRQDLSKRRAQHLQERLSERTRSNGCSLVLAVDHFFH